ncbi:MAG: histidine phosphatase family protein [Nocardioidaceae bacterium]|nr:histidine phosphatase family protein [Nocardioidaceae bacterium]MCL2612584.1 histidine phosphatase family protein [Nocardioidaceae bacterium]
MGLILLVRHGQASFGADDYDVLSPVGWDQGRALGRWLAEHGPAPATVVHGGMRRHRETWEAIAEGAAEQCRSGTNGNDSVSESAVRAQTALPEARVDPDWAEFDHLAVLARHAETTGAEVDHTADRRTFQEAFERATGHWAAGQADYPEPYADFVARSSAALERVAAEPGPALVVSSGGVIAALGAVLLAPAMPAAEIGPIWSRLNTVLTNASVSRVIVGRTGARLLTYNEHQHLVGDLLTYR